MKKAELFFFLAVLSAMIFIFACSKKNNPSGPGPDKNTPTVTMTSCVGCTATCTPTITVTTVQSYYGFDDGSLEGWTIGGWGGPSACAANAASVTNTPVHSGAYSIKLDYSLTSSCDQAVLSLTFSQPVDLTGKSIVAHLWAPASLVGNGTQYYENMGITGSQGEETDANPLTITASGSWQLVSWSPSLAGEEAVTQISIIIGKISGTSPDTSGLVYIDDIVWL